MQTILFEADQYNMILFHLQRVEQLASTGTRLPIVSSRQLERMLGISKSTLKRWRDKGLLPYISIERNIYYAMADVEALLLSHRVVQIPHVAPASDASTCSR
jgi:hypothetical protein